MEFDEYRYVLAELKEAFGDRAWIKTAELARYEGCDKRTVKARYGIPKGVEGIDRTILARRKCMLTK